MSQEIVTYLSMDGPDALVASARRPDFTLRELSPIDPAFHRWLYAAVGATYQWTDRAGWSLADWAARAHDPRVSLWLAETDGPIGFAELAIEDDGAVEIAYFGLLNAFIGRGYGGAVLTEATRAAWQLSGARRVWLHTCNFDHPNALANYQARGFTIDRRVAVDG